MSNTKSNYSELISKLDQFIRKYYINKIIKGTLYTLGLILALFLLFNVLEYNFYFSTTVRKLLFLSFIGSSILALGYWVLIPLTRYFRLGKTISHEQAAHIIGQHFQGVEDKLLNILQLKKQESDAANIELLEASIDQKTESIKLVPFKSAIDLSSNRKYLKYALPPFLLLLVILFAAPSIIKDGTHRLINNNKEFEREAPFSFVLEEDNPSVLQFEDYKVNVKVEGEVLPAEAFIEVDNFQYRLQKEAPDTYSYTLRNVQKDTPFKIFSGSVASENNLLKVLAKPNLADFKVSLDYPGYTGRKDETIENLGDLIMPEGTRVKWTFNTINTENINLKFSSTPSKLLEADRKGNDQFVVNKRMRNNDYYKVFIANENVPQGDSVSYSINVIKDQYPTISVEQFKDSVENDIVFFVGQASDDYAINSITFNYNITKENGGQMPLQTIKLKDYADRQAQYEYTFDIEELGLKSGENVSYYFEVKDNDAVNGSKSAKTGVMSYAKPSVEELKEMENVNEEAIKDNLEESLKDMEKLRENFRKMREKLLQEKELDWQDKKELEKLLEEQKKIQDKLEKAKEKFKQNLENQEEMENQPDEKIKEKQEKLEELFEEAKDPKMEELMQKIEELMQDLQKENALEMMEEMEMNNETQEKDMKRLMELYKSLELEKEVMEMVEELEKLAEEQEELAKENEENKKSDEQIKKEQEELNEKFDELKEEMEKLEEKNEELEQPKNLGDDNEEQMEDIQEEMQESSEQMQQENKEGASKSQKSASQKMKQMAGSLQQNMESGDQEQQTEDIKMIRQLLENLVNLSFDQEDLVADFSSTRSTTPRYVELVQVQFKLKDDFRLVEDSLTALANRNDKVQGFVLDKVAEIKRNMKESLTELEERKSSQAADNQRRTMKNLNDLALMLSESMEEMQQQAGASMPGSQMCNKPGGASSGGQGKGKVPMNKITEGSQGMQEMMKGMQDKIGKGEKPSSKDFAQAAARQAAMRKALQDMQKDAQEQGKGSKELEEIIKEMDKIEEDLVNKRLDSEMLKRQQSITTRLLEAEKAERQREFDNKRKAETAAEQKREFPPSLKEYIKKREAELEMYKTVSPALRPYYKYLVDEYYKALKSN